MSPPLAPAAALAWLGSLSIDLRATAVLDAAGAVVAGDADVGRRAAAALAAAPGAADVRDGDLLVARGATHAVAATVGPLALARLTHADLRAALDAIEGA